MLMTVLTAYNRDEIAWPVLAIIAWITCAVAVSNIDIPYAFLRSDNTVLTHTTTYRGGAHMIYFFLGFAIVFIAIFFNRVFTVYRREART